MQRKQPQPKYRPFHVKPPPHNPHQISPRRDEGAKRRMTEFQPLQVITYEIWKVTDREREAIKNGRGACKFHDLRETGNKCANHAVNIGAKSWDIIPMIWLGMHDPKVYVKFYNREGHGMCTFGDTDHVTGRIRGKELFWWVELPQPHWLDLDKGVRDRTEGQAFHPENQI